LVPGPTQEALRRRRFSSDEEVIGAVQNWLKTRPKILFFDGIKETGETVEPVH
jgi:hypothetical protein